MTRDLSILALVFVVATTAPSRAVADEHGFPYCPSGDVVGAETIWRATREEARRAARRHWRNAVRDTPLLGPDYTDWGLAEHPPGYYDGSDGYFCRTVEVLWDPWHKCAAWGVPCTLLAEPRSATLPGATGFAREEAPLELRGATLTIHRTTRRGTCPAGFILTAEVTGAGTTGRALVTLHDSAGRAETVTIRPEAFRADPDGGRIARVDFVREYEGATERSFRVATRLEGDPPPSEPQRVSPKSIEVNCRTEGLGGFTLPTNPPEQ